jgi:hypothetical protein
LYRVFVTYFVTTLVEVVAEFVVCTAEEAVFETSPP